MNKKILSDLTIHMKYAKFIPELNRRETWEELVTRNKEMHQKRYPELADQIQLNYKYVYDKKDVYIMHFIFKKKRVKLGVIECLLNKHCPL